MDWCTGWFDGTWGYCCAVHDVAYEMGFDKWKSDIALGKCVAKEAGAIMGAIMTVGVVLFGGLFYRRAKKANGRTAT